MEVIRRTRRARAKQTAKWGDDEKVLRDDGRYPHRLQFYNVYPTDEVSLEDFESLAVERLRLLKMVEVAKVRWPKRGDEFDTYLRKATQQHMPLDDGVDDPDRAFTQRRNDHLSHFILRLAYCKSEELRRWFLVQECELFRYRMEQQKHSETYAFLRDNGFHYSPITDELKEEIAPMLARAGFNLSESMVKASEYYEVPFEEAIELVRSRRVFLRNGYAYVPRKDMLPIIGGLFRAKLSASLVATARALPQLEEDDRILPMLNTLSKQYLGKDYGSKKTNAGEVSAQDIPQLAKESFPLCMRMAQDALEQNHHLKHGGRMQYGLFLKGIGLSLEDALMFWRTEFTKAMSVDKFDKQYAYNIRHNYGKEGRRANYTPYSCMKIIMGNAPSSGDSHGCPFKHYDEGALRVKLLKYNTASATIAEISRLVREQHYQLACAKYFEATHNAVMEEGVQHPNQYFEESRRVRTGGSEQPGSTTSAPLQPSTSSNDAEPDDDELLAAMDTAADDDEA